VSLGAARNRCFERTFYCQAGEIVGRLVMPVAQQNSSIVKTHSSKTLKIPSRHLFAIGDARVKISDA